MQVIIGSGIASLIRPFIIPAFLNGPFARDRVLIFCLSATSIAQSCYFNIYPRKQKGKKTL